jgi:hypothetical protein
VRSTEGQFGKQVRGTIPKAREYNSCHLNNIMTALPRNYHPISSMCTFGQCFVDKVKEPVRIFEVGQNALSSGSTRSYQQLDVSTVDDLNAHFASTQSDCTCRVMSVPGRRLIHLLCLVANFIQIDMPAKFLGSIADYSAYDECDCQRAQNWFIVLGGSLVFLRTRVGS